MSFSRQHAARVGRASLLRRIASTAAGFEPPHASRNEVASRTLQVAPRATSDGVEMCGPRPCEYPISEGTTTALPIALGVAVPLVIFTIIMITIWRIRRKKQRLEKLNDKHADLDFGLGAVKNGQNRIPRKPVDYKQHPEMRDAGGHRLERGLSMDVGSPYVLPSELTDSRPSFHSLSRVVPDGENPYRPVEMIRSASPSGAPSVYSMRTTSRRDVHKDSASIWTSHSVDQGSKGSLLKNAQPPAESVPLDLIAVKTPPIPPPAPAFNVVPSTPIHDNDDHHNHWDMPSAHPHHRSKTPPPVPQKEDNRHGLPMVHEDVPFSETVVFPPRPPSIEVIQPKPDHQEYHQNLSNIQESELHLDNGHDRSNARYSTSLRPLPPHSQDVDEEPEARANRIRSFYKEYFDEKTEARFHTGYDDYVEDYNQEYLDSPTYLDAANGHFVLGNNAPYAEPITRRAMTPPPRAPPRFRGGSSASSSRQHSASGFGHHHHHRPRGYSTASAGGFRGRQPQPRSFSPALPLNNLPTPHLLKDDTAIFNAADFAPPATYRDRAEGRPDSPLGGQRSYSPSVRPFTPLASSFDDLRSMPSPHLLRKSSTFTNLDFAPPTRFRDDNGSDAGSIRSGRSNVSASHLANIRNGAYRVSRLPKGTVATRNEFAETLRPTWDQR